MNEIDWRAESRKWEQRCKTNRAEVDKLERELALAKAREREWRSAYHSLRLSVEDRLDRVTRALESWEEA